MNKVEIFLRGCFGILIIIKVIFLDTSCCLKDDDGNSISVLVALVSIILLFSF